MDAHSIGEQAVTGDPPARNIPAIRHEIICWNLKATMIKLRPKRHIVKKSKAMQYNCFPNERHITLAWGRDYGDVSPVRGVVLGGAGHHIVVSVDMAAV